MSEMLRLLAKCHNDKFDRFQQLADLPLFFKCANKNLKIDDRIASGFIVNLILVSSHKQRQNL